MNEEAYDLHTDPSYELLVNKFPHVAKKISFLWGHQEFYLMFNELMHDTRGGTRQGFPLDAGSALLKLHLKHAQLFPNPNPDKWEDAYRSH